MMIWISLKMVKLWWTHTYIKHNIPWKKTKNTRIIDGNLLNIELNKCGSSLVYGSQNYLVKLKILLVKWKSYCRYILQINKNAIG